MPITDLFLNNDTQSSFSPKFGPNPRVPTEKIKNKAGKLMNSFNSTEASIDDNIKWIVNIPSITKNSKSIKPRQKPWIESSIIHKKAST